MIESLVRGALAQRLVVAVVSTALPFFWPCTGSKLAGDAFPDATYIL